MQDIYLIPIGFMFFVQFMLFAYYVRRGAMLLEKRLKSIEDKLNKS